MILKIHISNYQVVAKPLKRLFFNQQIPIHSTATAAVYRASGTGAIRRVHGRAISYDVAVS